jgi:hypothetical protein
MRLPAPLHAAFLIVCFCFSAASQSVSSGALEDKLVIAPNQTVYLITQGHRSLILDPAWIGHSRYAGHQPIPVSQAELQVIPFGPDLIYESTRKKAAGFILVCLFFSFFFLSKYGSRLRSRLPTLSIGENPFWNLIRRHARSLIFIGFTSAALLREPDLLRHPRFWAEEGTSWFQYAISHSTLSTLVYIQPFTGYLNLVANLAAIAAAKTALWFGLQYAPLATTLVALLTQLFVFALILFGSSALFDSLWKAVAGCMIALFAATATGEIWLTTINVITYMGLISMLFLFERTWDWPRPWRWLSRGMLAFCALSSPYSVALVPLFLILAFHGKRKEQKIQSLILLLCFLLQAGVTIHSRTTNAKAWSLRGKAVEVPNSLVGVFCNFMVVPAVGYPADEIVFGELGLREAWTTASSFPPRPPAASALLAGWFCGLLIGSLLWALRGQSIFSPPTILIASFLTISVLVCMTSLDSNLGGRYAFLPGATFLLLLMLAVQSYKSPAASCLIMLVLSCGLANGLLAYGTFHSLRGPSWSSEVQLWQADHSHVLLVWPGWWVNNAGGITYSGR